MTRRLIGYLWRCDDPECNCTQPVIEEEATRSDGFVDREFIWKGTFLSDPSSREEDEYLSTELTEQCRRHQMEEDPFEPGRWEREI